MYKEQDEGVGRVSGGCRGWHALVCGNCSTDNTAQVLHKHTVKHTDTRRRGTGVGQCAGQLPTVDRLNQVGIKLQVVILNSQTYRQTNMLAEVITLACYKEPLRS